MKHSPSEIVWGVACDSGTDGLYFLAPGTTVNGGMYVELLNELLANNMHIHKCTILMYDGAAYHCSKEEKNYLMSTKVTTLE